MQAFGGASETVPTVSVPGVMRPSAAASTELSGSTPAVVYLSSRGRLAVASLGGNAVAFSSPAGAHWLVSAEAGGAAARPHTIRVTAITATSFPAMTFIFATYRPVARRRFRARRRVCRAGPARGGERVPPP